MKICYSIIIKNKARNKKWTARIRENGKTLDIPLNTEDKSAAKEWLNNAENALKLYNTIAAANNGIVPADIAEKVIHADNKKKAIAHAVATPTIEKVANEWLQSLLVAGRRHTSVETYRRAVRAVIKDYENDNVDRLLDPRVCQAMLSRFADRSDNTRRNYSTTLREIVKYYGDAYDTEVGKSVKACARVKIDEQTVTFWTELEMTRIINCVKNQNRDAQAEIKTYFELLAATGMRNTEAYLIEVRDLHDGCLFLRPETTKARKARTVPLSEGMFCKLARMCNTRSSQERIFRKVPSSQQGRLLALTRAIDEVNRICRPENKIEYSGLHQFRRSAAIMLYKKMDIKTVAAILGHQPAVSLRYYQVARGQEETLEEVRKVLDDSDLRQPTTWDDYADLF